MKSIPALLIALLLSACAVKPAAPSNAWKLHLTEDPALKVKLERSSPRIREMAHARRMTDIYTHAVETAYFEPVHTDREGPVLTSRDFYFAFTEKLQFTRAGSSEARYYLKVSETPDGRIFNRTFLRSDR